MTDRHTNPDPPPTRLPLIGGALALLVAVMPGAAGAQRQGGVPPEEVARAVVLADSTGDWGALLRLAHPDALIRFRGLQTFQLRMLGTPEPVIDTLAADSIAADSSLQARWHRARTRQVRFMLDSVFQVPDLDSLAHTSPDTVFARWFRGSRAIHAGDSGAVAAKRPPSYRVIGAVRASDTLAYVVVERPVVQPLGPMPQMFRDFPHETHQTEVMVMRRYGREWRSMLDGVGEPYGFGAELEAEE
ncbi:MAG: hypothetical protein H0X69_00440 [Gemmatimonadales bacterium]|nr:hypothetical protein [Gemmatimonadales bacterium]